MSSCESRLKRTRVSTRRWRKLSFGVTRQIAGIDPVVAPREQAQALRRLVEQLGLGQDAAADRHHRVGREDVGAAQILVAAARVASAASALVARQPVGERARQLALLGHLVDVGGQQRVGLDAGLVEQREPPRRAGREHEFGRPIMAVCHQMARSSR